VLSLERAEWGVGKSRRGRDDSGRVKEGGDVFLQESVWLGWGGTGNSGREGLWSTFLCERNRYVKKGRGMDSNEGPRKISIQSVN